jgi:hypothetical protein
MAQTGFTPILIYSSSTTTNAPAVGNLTNSTLGSELAINITDGKLFYKDNANAIQVIGWKVTPATAGGTGQTSYAVGDILYANTTTTLAKLADVATGNALISGGVGVAPAWGKIGLTTHVSGTLDVANGGTGTGTAFTAGSVVFAGASGVYSQDNANFFWDDTNNRLGIGSNAPKGPLDVKLASSRWMTTKYDTNITLSAENDAGNPENMRLYGENIRLYTPQGGFTAANLTLGAELKSTSGDFHVYTGNVVIGTSGKGIDFSATAGTGTSELLADYEEGTWTPTVAAITGSYTTVTGQAGTYTKVGRQVTCKWYFVVSNKGTGAGGVNISNLPFASNASAGNFYAGSGYDTSLGVAQITAMTATTSIDVYKYDGTDPVVVTRGQVGQLTYFV